MRHDKRRGSAASSNSSQSPTSTPRQGAGRLVDRATLGVAETRRVEELIGVGSRTIRDFRGAMVGRGDKGVIITTATFTPAAQQEAGRDGATPIDLIDGDLLCDLLKCYRVGVSTTERVVERVTVDDSWWQDHA